MKRTQISLDQSEYDFVRGEAVRRRISMAAIIRSLIRERMERLRRVPADHPFRDIIGLGRGDGAPVSEKHDEYLYGLHRRRR